ncbi:MAG TPA: cytochrome c peroxidase [candidate division Zixibacteria bacterium]|nr:cytochrome c peroxidase [candidate division Zixibacteria bacterium]
MKTSIIGLFKKILICIAILLIAAVGGSSALTEQEQLGKNLFTDINLSDPIGQSCQDCHVPAVAFTEPDEDRGVSEGVIQGRFGNRNAPSAAYAAFSPQFSFEGGIIFRGGQFWDGRAANLTEQAKGPFLNKLEMNNPNESAVLDKINASAYALLFNTVCVNSSNVESRYTCMADAIAAFEKTAELNKFNSKFDLTVGLNNPADLTAQEFRGLQLFRGKAKCNVCHAEPFFTDFDYENIGVPSNLGMLGNTSNLTQYFPFYFLAPELNPDGLFFVDTGLAGNPAVPDNLKLVSRGKMKAPTLRNVNLTAPYMHNGVFRTLKEVVHFYNTRDTLGNCANTAGAQPGVNCWPASEVLENRNIIIGNLQLTDAEENDIVEFLKTLTDDFNVSQITPGPTAQEQLGKILFTDISLSEPEGQSCQDCHDPVAGFAERDKTHGVSAGVIPGRFGNRNAPSAAYAAFSPEFSSVGGLFTGGQFWDGRAANLTEQAKGPFLNPLEMNNTDEIMVLNKINASANAHLTSLFNQVCGQTDVENQTDVESKYTCMADAIAAFEKTAELNNFSSKFDLAPTGLSIQESRGRGLFNGKAGCVECHPDPIFTNFNYENIGVPSNLGMSGDSPVLQNYFPFYYPPLAPGFNPDGLNFVDTGLAANPKVPVNQKQLARGKMKVPTLRNVDRTAPYMHNGVFNDLKTVVHFYNTRDLLPICASTAGAQPGVNCWPAPEVFENLNRRGIGNLGLTDAEENDIVAFLKTLTDHFALPPPPEIIAAQEELGKFLFTDTSLSTPVGQSCEDCHVPAVAFTEPNKTRGVSEGVITGRFGNRNAPSTAYAAFTPDFGLARAKGNLIFAGGLFWDGRAANMTEQAKGPFLNPLEMNNPSKEAVLNKIQAAPYAPLFNQVCGDRLDVESKYTCVADAIVAFERTKEMNKFNSKFDLNNLTGLTAQERSGFALFTGKARCFLCHPTVSEAFAQPLFTDFDYENIGVPTNLGMMGDTPALQNYFPFYYALEFNPDGLNFVDIGLAANPNMPDLLKPTMRGLMKAPTLRNVEITAPYMHNGVFKDLKTVVHFYNTRDTLGNCATTAGAQPGVNCWPAPEVLSNLNIDIGNLQLTLAEENDIVAFLKTLTDVTANNTYKIVLNPVVPIVNNTLTVTVLNNTLPEPGIVVTFVLNGTDPIFTTTDIKGKSNFTPSNPGILNIQATKDGVSLVNRSVTVVAAQLIVTAPAGGNVLLSGGSSGGSSSGGGGGGGGTSGEKFSNIIVKEKYDEAIFKDIVTSYRFKNASNPITHVNVTGNNNAGLITAMIEVLKGTSTLVTENPPGVVYMNVNTWLGTSGYATPKNLKEVVIRFRVPNSWMQSNNVDAKDVKLLRWDSASKKWITLETKVKEKDSSVTYFEGTTNALSPLAISAVASPPGGPVAGGQSVIVETPLASGTPDMPKGTPGFEVLIAALAICALYMLRRKI